MKQSVRVGIAPCVDYGGSNVQDKDCRVAPFFVITVARQFDNPELCLYLNGLVSSSDTDFAHYAIGRGWPGRQ